MAGTVVVNRNRPDKDEMMIKVSKHEHSQGEGGPEKNSGKEGPDTMPGRKGD